jgi:hypothetical protein
MERVYVYIMGRGIKEQNVHLILWVVNGESLILKIQEIAI